MTLNDCKTPLYKQDYVKIDELQSKYSITASADVYLGYTIPFCYSCDIKPTGLPIITFKKDNLEVKALAGKACSSALYQRNFNSIAPVKYKSKESSGSFFTFGQDYQFFFIHSYQKECKLKSCSLMQNKRCDQELKQSSPVIIKLDPAEKKYKLMASETVTQGYK